MKELRAVSSRRAVPLTVLLALLAALVSGIAGSSGPAMAQGDRPSAGTWQDLRKNTKGTFRRVKKDVTDYYKASPKLQTGVEGAMTVAEVIKSGALEYLPLGDAADLLMNAPEISRGALTVWLQRKKTQAMMDGRLDLVDRYDAYLSCLNGDCAALHALLRKPESAPRIHVGEKQDIDIVTLAIADPELQEGRSTRISVSLVTVVGGDVTIRLDSPGSAIGPTSYTVQTKPGETVSKAFDQFFPTAGRYRLLVSARDSRSDDIERAWIVVTPKVVFDGAYAGTMRVEVPEKGTTVVKEYGLAFTIVDGTLKGTASAVGEKLREHVTVSSTLEGRVDDKGVLTATWTYSYQNMAKFGVKSTLRIGAALEGSIRDGRVEGRFACTSEASDNAEDYIRSKVTPENDTSKLVAWAMHRAVDVWAKAYKDAPGSFEAARSK